jgi:hypothetical protein
MNKSQLQRVGKAVEMVSKYACGHMTTAQYGRAVRTIVNTISLEGKDERWMLYDIGYDFEHHYLRLRLVDDWSSNWMLAEITQDGKRVIRI